jgi:hypothetical protein
MCSQLDVRILKFTRLQGLDDEGFKGLTKTISAQMMMSMSAIAFVGLFLFV